MVYAYADSYLQFSIRLNQEDVEELEKRGKLFCRVERSSRETTRRRKFPLWLYLCDEERPRDDELGKWKENNQQKYEFYISKKRLELIKQGKCVDADYGRVWVRSINMGLDTVL